MTYELIYKACLHAVETLGPDVKSMSWFKRNWSQGRSRRVRTGKDFKKAA